MINAQFPTKTKFLYQAASGQALATGATHSDCVRAAMFWAKTRMGWRETSVQEITGKDGATLQAPVFNIVGVNPKDES